MYANYHDELPFANDEVDAPYDINELSVDFDTLNNLVFNQFDANDQDADDPDYFLTNIRNINIPLSEYISGSIPSRQNVNSLKIRSFNIRSVKMHLDMFLDSHGTSFDILCLCETQLNDDLTGVGSIDAYDAFHEFRLRKGGGVSLFIKPSLSPIHLPDMSISYPYLECVGAEFTIGSKKSLILSLYRPPSGNVTDFISEIKTLLTSARNRGYDAIYAAGDFNINLLANKNSQAQLVTCMNSFNMYCAINKPTRVQRGSATLIDHIWVSNIGSLSNSYIIMDDVTDHFITEAHLLMDSQVKSQPTVVKTRNLNDVNINNFKTELSSHNWNQVLIIDNPSTAYDLFYSDFKSMYDKHFPVVEKRVTIKTRDDSYITPALKSSLIEKRRLHRLAKKWPLTYYDAYIRYRNTCNAIVKAARDKFYQEKLQSNMSNPRSMWQTINKVMGRSSTVNDSVIKIPADCNATPADFVNDYFDSSIKSIKESQQKANQDAFKRFLPQSTDFSMRLGKVTEEEVVRHFRKNKSNACGHDDISPKVVKACVDSIKMPITYIINQTFKTGIFPELLKVAKIIPLHKGGDKTDIKNKRPISILSVFSKVFERAIYSRLSNYLETQNLLIMQQHGFRPNKSTESALLNFLNPIYEAIRQKKKAIGVFIDFSKAFDCLNHTILLAKLENLGIRGSALKLLENYLQSRKQIVFYNKTFSRPITPSFGTPQGSLLGPLLFLIYVNDIVNASSELLFALYADDVNSVKSHASLRSLIDIVNNELAVVYDWIISNELSVNILKICFMLFNVKNSNLNIDIKLGPITIPKVTESKLLGLYLDENLKWDVHFERIDLLSLWYIIYCAK